MLEAYSSMSLFSEISTASITNNMNFNANLKVNNLSTGIYALLTDYLYSEYLDHWFKFLMKQPHTALNFLYFPNRPYVYISLHYIGFFTSSTILRNYAHIYTLFALGDRQKCPTGASGAEDNYTKVPRFYLISIGPLHSSIFGNKSL